MPAYSLVSLVALCVAFLSTQFEALKLERNWETRTMKEVGASLTLYQRGLPSYRILNKIGDNVYIGGNETLFKLSVVNNGVVKTEIQLETAEPMLTVNCELQNPGNHQTVCWNFIRVVEITRSGELFVCGSNAFSGLCYRCSQDLGYCNKLLSSFPRLVPGSPIINPATAIFNSIDGDDMLYAGSVFDQTFQRYSMQDLASDNPITLELETVTAGEGFIKAPTFVGKPFEYIDDVGNKYVFVFYRETALEYDNHGNIEYSRIARVCQNDTGGTLDTTKFVTFIKARLNCSIPDELFPYYFDDIQDVIWDNTNKEAYAVFTSQRLAPAASALCRFRMEDIMKLFDEGDSRQQEQSNSLWLSKRVENPRPGTCTAKYDVIDYPPLLDKLVPNYNPLEPPPGEQEPPPVNFNISNIPTLYVDGARFTSLAVDFDYDGVFFFGTSTGTVIKAYRQNCSDCEKQFRSVEITELGTSGHITGLALLTRHSVKHLVITTEHSVVTWPLNTKCSARTEHECQVVRFPYCTSNGTACTCATSNTGCEDVVYPHVERRTVYISSSETTQIASPLHPRDYPNNIDITWIIQTDEGLTIHITFCYFDTEDGRDILRAGDGGDSADAATAFYAFSGSGKAPDIRSSGNVMWLRFTADSGTNCAGFSLEAASILSKECFAVQRPRVSNQCIHADLIPASVPWADVTALDSWNNTVFGGKNIHCTEAGDVLLGVGSHTVTCIASDPLRCLALGSFVYNVTVSPVLTVPNVSDHRTSPCEVKTLVSWPEVTATDYEDGTINDAIICTDSGDGTYVNVTGGVFGAGLHTVTCTVTDSDGCTESASFAFSVTAVQAPPIVTIPSVGDQVTDPGRACATVTWAEVTATDEEDGNISDRLTCTDSYETCVNASGGVFKIGPHTVTCKANDTDGCVTSKSFTFKVTDQEPPQIQNCPPDDNHSILRHHTPSTQQFHAWSPPQFCDNSGVIVNETFTCSGKVCCRSGFGSFPPGNSTVTYQVSDPSGNTNVCEFTVTIRGFCGVAIREDVDVGHLTWPVTLVGAQNESIEKCPITTKNAGRSRAVSTCVFVDAPVYFDWGHYELLDCGEPINKTVKDLTNVTVDVGNVIEVAQLLAELTALQQDQNVDTVSEILENIVEAQSGDPKVTNAVVQTVNNVIVRQDLEREDQGSSSAIIMSVEKQVALTLHQEGGVSIQQQTVHVEAVTINATLARNGVGFVSVQRLPETGQRSTERISLDETQIEPFVDGRDIANDSTTVQASIKIPRTVINSLESGSDGSFTQLRASCIIYSDDTLFQSDRIRANSGASSPNLTLGGFVVSLTVEELVPVNFTEPVIIQFKAPKETLNETLCVFWDFSLAEGVGDWSQDGCEVAEVTSDAIVCHCNHLTNFAILVSVQRDPVELPVELAQALDIISQIGCAFSIVSLTITLIIYMSIRKLRKGKSRQIFIHFCVSLLMLYIVFLTGIDNAKGSVGGCAFVAAVLHYLTLSTMMWMAVEARNMYVSTVMVFPEDTPRYMVKACLVAWGSPWIVLAITLPASFSHYTNGVLNEPEKHYCFIKPGLALYLGLLLPIGLILIHNIITFILVMRSLLKVREESRSKQISRRLQNAVGISTLMGLSWVFGFLAIGSVSFAFQLLFCLANSFQGVIVFIMFCARREEVQAAVAPYLRHLCGRCRPSCMKGTADAKRDARSKSRITSETNQSRASVSRTNVLELSASDVISASPSGLDSANFDISESAQ